MSWARANNCPAVAMSVVNLNVVETRACQQLHRFSSCIILCVCGIQLIKDGRDQLSAVKSSDMVPEILSHWKRNTGAEVLVKAQEGYGAP